MSIECTGCVRYLRTLIYVAVISREQFFCFFFRSLMEDYKVTQEMKRHAVIITICAKHTDLEISNFLNCARSFVHKVCRESEASAGDVETIAKRKRHEERSDTTRNTQFVQQVQEIVDESPSKSMRAIARDLNVSEGLIRRVIHENLHYKSYVMRRGQFMSAQTRNQRLIRGKRRFVENENFYDYITPNLCHLAPRTLIPLIITYGA